MKIYSLDIETFPNWYYILFKEYKTSNKYEFELDEWNDKFTDHQARHIKSLLENNIILTYNGMNFDIPIVLYSLIRNLDKIYNLSKHIIHEEGSTWQLLKEISSGKGPIVNPYAIENHVDLMQVSPALRVSLKLTGCRLHYPKLQEMPVKPDKYVTSSQIKLLKDYCYNDCKVTEHIYEELKERVELRLEINRELNIPCLFLSDAQIAEKIFRKRLNLSAKTETSDKKVFKLEFPEYIKFKSPELQRLKENLESVIMSCENGKLIYPQGIGNKVLDRYKVGVGGLHSTEKGIMASRLKLLDFSSYYPHIISLQNIIPDHLNIEFLDIYQQFIRERLDAKTNKEKIKSEMYKIIINGAFGKFANKYSVLFDPECLGRVTMIGQLTLLMLIERLEKYNVQVISANTDGILCRDRKNYTIPIIKQFHEETGFNIDTKNCQKIHCQRR